MDCVTPSDQDVRRLASSEASWENGAGGGEGGGGEKSRLFYRSVVKITEKVYVKKKKIVTVLAHSGAQ